MKPEHHGTVEPIVDLGHPGVWSQRVAARFEPNLVAFEETIRMVELTLYCQPLIEPPYLSQKSLQKGVVEHTKKGVFSNYMMLTDIGEALWRTAQSIDKAAKIQQHNIPFFQRETADAQELQWNIELTTRGFKVLMQSRRYISGSGSEPSNFFIQLDFSGDHGTIVRYLNQFMDQFDRDPYKFTDIGKLAKKIGMSRQLVVKGWKDIKLAKRGMELLRSVEGTVKEVKSFCKSRKLSADLEKQIQQALRPAVERGDMNKAKIEAKKIKSRAEEIKRAHRKTKRQLEKTKDLIRMAAKLGRDVKRSKALYKKGLQAYKAGSYKKARSYAIKSSKLTTPKKAKPAPAKAAPAPTATAQPQPQPAPVAEPAASTPPAQQQPPTPPPATPAPSPTAPPSVDDLAEEIEFVLDDEGEEDETTAIQLETLNEGLTFENYVISSSNQFVAAAAKAVANQPAKVYNPFFIHSGVGLGKTHLLHAIGNEARRQNPNFNIIYVTSENFTNDLIAAINKGDIQAFRKRYRSGDMLMVDDIQFLEGKEATQEEFFHTFNALYNANKQICITSDRPAAKLHNLTDRIVSRFEGGLIADIQPPTTEMKLIILQNQAREEGLIVPSDVLYFIAENIRSNIRKLKGALTKLGAYASITHAPITMETAREALKSIIPPERKAELGAQQQPQAQPQGQPQMQMHPSQPQQPQQPQHQPHAHPYPHQGYGTGTQGQQPHYGQYPPGQYPPGTAPPQQPQQQQPYGQYPGYYPYQQQPGAPVAPPQSGAGAAAAGTTADEQASQTELIGGVSYLIEEPRPNLCFKLFEQRVAQTNRGLIITRANPALVRKKYQIGPAQVLWLTDRTTEGDTIYPRLESMVYTIEDFYEEAAPGVILLDGVEYLISLSGFEPVLKFVRECIDGVSLSQTAFLVPLNQAALSDQEASMFEREMETIEADQ